MLNIFLLTMLVIYLIDRCKITEQLYGLLKKWLDIKNIHDRPFNCSLCMTHHVGLIYLLITGFSLKLYLFVCLMSLSVTQLNYALDLIFDTIEILLRKYEDTIKKLL